MSHLHPSFLLNCRGRLVSLEKPVVMGILNVSPDSFFSGSKYTEADALVEGAGKMLEDGATFLDIGGMSSRPGAKMASPSEELDRVMPAIEALRKHFQEAFLSIDTLRSKVAAKALEAGVDIVNDISGGTFDKHMIATVAKYEAPYVIMHMQGTPEKMQQDPKYEDVVLEVLDFFKERISACREAGILDCIVDPGFGFGKNLEHNYELLRHLHTFSILQAPILIGLSRKSMVNKVLGTKAEAALNGTTALHTIALLNGANILRVHDVNEAMEAIRLVDYYQSAGA